MVRVGAGSAVTFRNAEEADVPAIALLIETCYRGEESLKGWTTEANFLDSPRTSVAEVAGIVGGPDSMMLCGESGGELVACCELRREADWSAYMGMLSVLPALQGRGIGRSMTEEAELTAWKEWGAAVMTLLVITRRTELIAWYERLGYTDSGNRVPFPFETPNGLLEFAVLQKRLGDQR